MKVSIIIECEDLFEVVQHLEALKKQISKSNKVKKYTSLKGVSPPTGVRSVLKDNNCYGTHRAVFIPEPDF